MGIYKEIVELALLNLRMIDVPWDFDYFSKHCPFKIETDLNNWPKEILESHPGAFVGVPCTDGATVWIPKYLPEVISLLLHEIAHATMHYPNGPDPRRADPWALKGKHLWSEFEAEAAAIAVMVQTAAGREDRVYNKAFLTLYQGKPLNHKKLLKYANKVIDCFADKHGDPKGDDE